MLQMFLLIYPSIWYFENNVSVGVRAVLEIQKKFPIWIYMLANFMILDGNKVCGCTWCSKAMPLRVMFLHRAQLLDAPPPYLNRSTYDFQIISWTFFSVDQMKLQRSVPRMVQYSFCFPFCNEVFPALWFGFVEETTGHWSQWMENECSKFGSP